MTTTSDGTVPGEPDSISYIGHPKVVCKSVVCIICERVYYKSDFNIKLKIGAKYLSNAYGYCHMHNDEIKKFNENEADNINECDDNGKLRLMLIYFLGKCKYLNESRNKYKKLYDENLNIDAEKKNDNESLKIGNDEKSHNITLNYLQDKIKLLEQQIITLNGLNDEMKKNNVLLEEKLRSNN